MMSAMPFGREEEFSSLGDALAEVDRLRRRAAAWKALAKVLHGDEIHYRVDEGWRKYRVAASMSARTEATLRHEIVHRDARIAALEKERDELRDAFARLPDPPLYAEPVSDDERWARCLGTQIRDARGLIKRARVAEEEAEDLRARLRVENAVTAARTPLDSLDELTRLILGNGPLSLSAAKERVMDMMNVIAACDDAFSNAQLDEDHVEHIIHSHSDSIFDYYRVLAKDLRPADRALADYNNKLCDEMEAHAAAKGGPRGIDG